MPKNCSTPAENNSQAKLRNETIRDLTTSRRVIPISALAMVIGLLCAFVALALLRLIGLFTNLFYFGRCSTSLVSPAGNHLGIFSVLVPVVGGDYRCYAALWLGAHSRSWNTRSDRINSAKWQPYRAEDRFAEANFLGHFHRIRSRRSRRHVRYFRCSGSGGVARRGVITF